MRKNTLTYLRNYDTNRLTRTTLNRLQTLPLLPLVYVKRQHSSCLLDMLEVYRPLELRLFTKRMNPPTCVRDLVVSSR